MSIGGIAAHAVIGSGTYAPAVLADSPLAYWRLGEASGTALADASGNSRTATLAGSGLTLGTTGALTNDSDTAITWTGSTGQRADIAYAAWQAPTDFSVEAWIKPSGSTTRNILSRYASTFATSTFAFRVDSDGVLRLYLFNGSSFGTVAGGSPSSGVWSHVAATVSGTSVTVYRDGSSAGTGTLSRNSTTASLCIGARSTDGVSAGTEPWNGVLDEVAYYGSALSGASIAAHYAAR